MVKLLIKKKMIEYEDDREDLMVEDILERQKQAEKKYLEEMRDLKGEEINGVTWGNPDPDNSEWEEELQRRDPFEVSSN